MEVAETTTTESAPSTPTVIETQRDNNASNETPTQQENTEQTNGHDGKPSGFDKVEFTPEQQQRIDRLYGNMKRYEGDAKDLRQINQQLISTIEQLHTGQQEIVSHIQGSDFQEAESRFASDREAAWNKGDLKAFNDANDKLHEIKTKRLLAQQQPKKTTQQQPQQRDNSGERIVNRAIDQGEINPVDANIARSWMSETDATGNLKRPWTQGNDPRNYAAALEGQAVFNSPTWADKPIADKLREVDRRMGLQTQQQTTGQNVLGAGNLTRGKQTNNIKLSPEIEKLAVKTKFGGPKAKSDQDHIEAWKSAVLKSQSKGAKK